MNLPHKFVGLALCAAISCFSFSASLLAAEKEEEVSVTVSLSRGSATETVWTSDLSHEYIRINAEYRT